MMVGERVGISDGQRGKCGFTASGCALNLRLVWRTCYAAAMIIRKNVRVKVNFSLKKIVFPMKTEKKENLYGRKMLKNVQQYWG